MTVEEIVKEIASNPLTDVTFSGGDPFFQAEVKKVAKIVKDLKKPMDVYRLYVRRDTEFSK